MLPYPRPRPYGLEACRPLWHGADMFLAWLSRWTSVLTEVPPRVSSLIGVTCVWWSILSSLSVLAAFGRTALSLDVLAALPADLPLGVVCAAVLPSFSCRGACLVGAADLLRSCFCSVCGVPCIHDQFGNHGCNFFTIIVSLASSSSELSDDDCPDLSFMVR